MFRYHTCGLCDTSNQKPDSNVAGIGELSSNRVAGNVQTAAYDFLCFVTGYHWADLLIFLQLSQTGNCSPGLSDISDTVTL